MHSKETETIFKALETFLIEIPSWGFANTGTRFGKFLQPAAASTIEEKFSDASQVHALTGVCPSLALHVLWDFAQGVQSCENISRLASRYGVRPGSINPNYFQEQIYKYGSFGNPDSAARSEALRRTKESIAIAQRLHTRDISLWFADGSNYPGTA
ncbi:MAG: sugar isomerase, partial [Bryobacteraceae bacterium]